MDASRISRVALQSTGLLSLGPRWMNPGIGAWAQNSVPPHPLPPKFCSWGLQKATRRSLEEGTVLGPEPHEPKGPQAPEAAGDILACESKGMREKLLKPQLQAAHYPGPFQGPRHNVELGVLQEGAPNCIRFGFPKSGSAPSIHVRCPIASAPRFGTGFWKSGARLQWGC